MRSLTITKYGPPEVLQLREAPDPEPGEGEVVIRVRASGLNFADIVARLGLYPDAPKPPCVVGYEVAGEIECAGTGVAGRAAGERVLALTRFKGHADRVIVPAAQAIPLPAGMSMEEGAALPVNYLTAYRMIHGTGVLPPGARVLVHMAAGGVGLAAIQLLRLVPGVTIFGTSSASKHEFLRKEGVHHPIDYRTADYAQEVRRIAGEKALHLVLDPLGGKDTKKSYRLLAPNGRLVAFGFANMVGGTTRSVVRVVGQLLSMPRFNPIEMMNSNRTVTGVNLGHLWSETELLGREMAALLALHSEGKIRPRVDKVFPLAEGPAAHRYIQERKNVGKVLFAP
ncbi:MAG: zinc-binding dehydrogenase [Planctomycetes bacterium]|nr:zinc-binding dehydrogenase [Planctomycetota bacterium]